MALIGLSAGAGIVLICWFVAQRSERRLHEQKMAMLRRKIERRQGKLAAKPTACHTDSRPEAE